MKLCSVLVLVAVIGSVVQGLPSPKEDAVAFILEKSEAGKQFISPTNDSALENILKETQSGKR